MCQHCQSHSCCGKGQTHSCGCNGQQSQCGCQKSCGCGSSCGCQNKGSECGSKGCDYATKFLELANQAWMEVLKEKIKENIQSNAKNMDELARLISEANHERWQKKMENKQCCGSFEERLHEFFNQACEAHHQQNSPSQGQSNTSSQQRF